MLALLLAALDQTIVSTAGPAIQRDLAIPPSLYAWITTSYLVASTVMLPIYGKLSDTFGRKPILLVGVVLFLVGSLLCGLAPSALTLIAARAVQGLGAASLFTTVFAVIADLYPPAERGRYMGLIGGVMGVASVVGPLVGGFITDTVGWHWAFLVNLPVGAVALWFIVTRMPRLGHPKPDRPRVDVAGAFWLVVAVVPLLVALSLGRVEPGPGGWTWGSWQILSMLAVSVAGAAAFARTERRAEDPILHFEIFRRRTIVFGIAAVFVLGSAFLFAIVFLPLYLVNVVGISATSAGMTMMPLTLGVVASSILSGQLVARLGHYRRLMLGALIVLGIGFAVMGFTLSADSTPGEITLKMILVGLGIGPSFPLYTLALQNAAAPDELGVVTATTTFARSLGQVIGVAAFGTVFAATLTGALGREVSDVLRSLPPDVRVLVGEVRLQGEAPSEESSTSGLAYDAAAARARIRQSVAASGDTLAPAALAAVDAVDRGFRNAFTEATAILYRLGLVLVALGLIFTLLLPELPLRRHHGAPPTIE